MGFVALNSLRGMCRFRLETALCSDAAQTTHEARGDVLFLLANLTWGGISEQKNLYSRSPKPSMFMLEQNSSPPKPGEQRPHAESASCQFHRGGSSEQRGQWPT